MLGLFIWYLGIWLGNQNDRTNNASNLEPSRARVRKAWRRINKAMTSGAARAAALAAVKRVAGCALAAGSSRRPWRSLVNLLQMVRKAAHQAVDFLYNFAKIQTLSA